MIHDADDDSPQSAHPEVDAVLATLEGLQHRPVEEHAAVFEAAHDRLRAVLSEGAEAPAGG